MAQTVTLSSAGTATIALDPVAKSTTVQVSLTAGSSGGFVAVELTLDDMSATPAPTVVWTLLSSAAGQTSSTFTNQLFTVMSPIGGVRLNSSGLGNVTGLTLKTLQSVTA